MQNLFIMMIFTKFFYLLFPGFQVTCFTRFSQYFISNFQDKSFSLCFWYSTISGVQDTETMLICYLVYVAYKKTCIFSVIFQEDFVPNHFSWGLLRICTTAIYQYHINDTVEVNYLIKQHECLEISILCLDRIKDWVISTYGIKYSITKYSAWVLKNFCFDPRLNLFHITELN